MDLGGGSELLDWLGDPSEVNREGAAAAQTCDHTQQLSAAVTSE